MSPASRSKARTPKQLNARLLIGVLRTDVVFGMYGEPSQLVDYINAEFGNVLDDEDREAMGRHKSKDIDGYSVQFNSGACAVWLRTPSLPTLAHEASHIADYIAKGRDFTCGEVRAHIVGHVVAEFCRAFETEFVENGKVTREGRA